MKRGYIRARKGGPDETVQRLALIMAGVNDDDIVLAPDVQRTMYLCPGDELVVYDAATLGTSAEAILGALIAIDRQDAAVHVIETGMTYRWHPEAVRIAALAKMGGEKARHEQTLEARKHQDRNRKITPQVAARAMELWRDPTILSAKEVTAILQGEGVTVSVRTLYNQLKIGRIKAKEQACTIIAGDVP